jgi:hypothetical protein
MLVRNPYKRVVSVYDNKFRNYDSGIQPFQQIHKLFLNRFYKGDDIKNLNVSDTLNSITLDEYLFVLKEFYKADFHTVPQSTILGAHYLKRKNLKIIKIEDKTELNGLFENMNLTIPHRNKSKSKGAIVLNENQKKIIYDLYKKDFETFDYQK